MTNADVLAPLREAMKSMYPIADQIQNELWKLQTASALLETLGYTYDGNKWVLADG